MHLELKNVFYLLISQIFSMLVSSLLCLSQFNFLEQCSLSMYPSSLVIPDTLHKNALHLLLVGASVMGL